MNIDTLKRTAGLLALLLLTCALALAGAPASQAQTVTVTQDITSNTTWTSNNTYELDGLVFVDGATLTIEPGTVIKGRRQSNISNEDGASALIVRQTAQINADGNESNPIIFTSEIDDMSDPNDLSPTDRGLWGGLILLGDAPISEPGEAQIEGVPDSESALFGGPDSTHSSGTVRYVSIRHGGFSISGVSGDEINGLTMGGVGSGTTIEYVEVFANLDDGFEWFGGTVHARNLVSAFCADDAFDWDTGFRGTGQFWFVIQKEDNAGRAAELDGFDSTTDENSDEFSDPVITNATLIGSGENSTATDNAAMRFRNGGAGEWYNSIVSDFPSTAVRIDEDDTAQDRFNAGDLNLQNNVFFGFGAGSDISSIVEGTFADDEVAADNSYQDPQIDISRSNDRGLDPRPSADLPSFLPKGQFVNSSASGSSDYPGVDLSNLQEVPYLGAFNPNSSAPWTTDWTALDTTDPPSGGTVTVTQDITSNTTWTSNNTYELDGLVFVDGATLTIEPGTVIKGRRQSNISNEDGASALIVRQTAQINADGNESNPIIFTSEIDDMSDPNDLSPTDRGLWGGLILLGDAPISEPGEAQIEGVPDSESALFGGPDSTHSSGTVRYVSIRHGGFSISGVSGDEINGLTMGGVGSGTTIEYVEVFANLDDGFEWFGGTVHARNLVSAFCADDAFDWDTGFRGTGQFWFVIQKEDNAGRAAELDGFDSTTDENSDEFSDPVITNATLIGSGENSTATDNAAMRFRNGGAGEWYNSIVSDFPSTAVRIDEDDTAQDRFNAGDLNLQNNVFFGFGAGSDISSIVEGTFADDEVAADNSYQDPQIDISRSNDRGLDPRPSADLPSFLPKGQFVNSSASGSSDYPGVDLSNLQNVTYLGAFAPGQRLWTGSWTALDTGSYILPVEIARFDVQKNENNFVLSWATASETDNAGFDVQRSVDDGPFETVGFREGAGTTEQGQTYRFKDANVPFDASTIDYRLRQKDLDGSTEMGPTRTVELGDPNSASLLSPFPNPTTEQATVRYKLPKDGAVTLSVYNVLGQRVATLVDGRQTAGRKEHTLDASSLSSGVYFLRLDTKNEVVTERLTIVR
jgi:azurin